MGPLQAFLGGRVGLIRHWLQRHLK